MLLTLETCSNKQIILQYALPVGHGVSQRVHATDKYLIFCAFVILVWHGFCLSGGNQEAQRSTGPHSVAFNKPLADLVNGCIPANIRASFLLYRFRTCYSQEYTKVDGSLSAVLWRFQFQ